MKRNPTKTSTKHLKPKTRQWVRSVMSTWLLEAHHERLLILAGEAWDRSESARKVIDEQGAVYFDRFKQPKARPETLIERDAKATFSRMLRELDLDLEAPAATSRPPALRSIKGGR